MVNEMKMQTNPQSYPDFFQPKTRDFSLDPCMSAKKHSPWYDKRQSQRILRGMRPTLNYWLSVIGEKL